MVKRQQKNHKMQNRVKSSNKSTGRHSGYYKTFLIAGFVILNLECCPKALIV